MQSQLSTGLDLEVSEENINQCKPFNLQSTGTEGEEQSFNHPRFVQTSFFGQESHLSMDLEINDCQEESMDIEESKIEYNQNQSEEIVILKQSIQSYHLPPQRNSYNLTPAQKNMSVSDYISTLLNIEIQDQKDSLSETLKTLAYKEYKRFQHYTLSKRGRPKKKGDIVPKLQHYWRDIRYKLTQELLIKLKEQQEIELIQKLQSIIKLTQKQRKNDDKWYVRCIEEEKRFKPHLLSLLEQEIYDQMIDKMTNTNRESYRHNRIPVLVYIQLDLKCSQYTAFRNYFHLYRTVKSQQ